MGAGDRGVGGEGEAAEFFVGGVAGVELAARHVVVAGADADCTASADGAPAVGHAAGGGTEAVGGLREAGANIGRVEHVGRGGQLGGVVAGLRVVNGKGTKREAGVFKRAATNRDVSLALGEVARLHVHLGIVEKGRNGSGVGAGRLLQGDAFREDRDGFQFNERLGRSDSAGGVGSGRA